MEDWALIRGLDAEGVPKARIANRLGISRTTVGKAVASDAPPTYERTPQPTSFTAFEARVRVLLETEPDMPATVIAERVGWSGSITWFRENVKLLRPSYRPPDPADRLVWEPGDAAQCDLWFPPKRIPLEDGSTALLPTLVITAAHSRFMTGRMIPTRKTEDLLLGSWELIQQLGRVPRRLIWDNEPGIGRGLRRAEDVAAFMGTLATTLVLLKPRDPESKGIVERRNGFFETSFMPGRTFASPHDFNAQFSEWLERANARVVRTIKTRRSIGSTPTGQRCWGCRRSRCISVGATGSVSAATITSASTATTTRSTRPRLVGSSMSVPICTGCGCAWKDVWSLIMCGCGPEG